MKTKVYVRCDELNRGSWDWDREDGDLRFGWPHGFALKAGRYDLPLDGLVVTVEIGDGHRGRSGDYHAEGQVVAVTHRGSPVDWTPVTYDGRSAEVDGHVQQIAVSLPGERPRYY